MGINIEHLSTEQQQQQHLHLHLHLQSASIPKTNTNTNTNTNTVNPISYIFTMAIMNKRLICILCVALLCATEKAQGRLPSSNAGRPTLIATTPNTQLQTDTIPSPSFQCKCKCRRIHRIFRICTPSGSGAGSRACAAADQKCLLKPSTG